MFWCCLPWMKQCLPSERVLSWAQKVEFPPSLLNPPAHDHKPSYWGWGVGFGTAAGAEETLEQQH